MKLARICAALSALCLAEAAFAVAGRQDSGVDGAKWIGEPPDGTVWTGVATNQPPLPKDTVRFRKTFSLRQGRIASAVVTSCGLGFSEVWINGAKADPDRMLAPCVCNYEKRVLTVEQDVTSLVRPGTENTVGIWVSPGFADDFNRHGWRWLWPKRTILRLDVKFADGTTQSVTTDGTWEFTGDTPIPNVSYYQGEMYDASREDPDWCRPSGSQAKWRPVAVLPPPRSPGGEELAVERHEGPPVRVCETFRPKKIIKGWSQADDSTKWTIDFGQNLSGVCEIRVKGKKGVRIDIRHAEEMENGELATFTLRNARQQDTFILAGTGEREFFRPRFTCHGFRYVEIFGWPGELVADDIAMRAVRADVRATAGFNSSSTTLNWLFNAAKWTLLSNLLSYPSDCCDRDERTPCRGDSMKSEVSAMRFFDMRSFYRKWLEDIKDDERPVPIVTGDLIMLPWRMWYWYGDREALERRYPDMTRLANYFLMQFPDYVAGKEHGYGDWCHPNNKKWSDYFCEVKAVESAAFYRELVAMRDSAAALGKTDDAALWAEHAEKAKTAYNATFYNPATHVYSNGLQVNYLLPLAYGLVPDEDRAAVTAKLVESIRGRDGCRLTTGGTGTRHLVEVLCDAGEPDLAFHLVTQPEYPSPEYMRSRGATTLWEQWYYEQAMNAHSHMMFTGLGSTLLTCFAGIRPVKPAYAEVEIRPACPVKLDFVEAWQDTPSGKVSVSWRRGGKAIDFSIEVPDGMKATLRLPDGSARPLSPGANSVRFGE